jgi:hypothetical protein
VRQRKPAGIAALHNERKTCRAQVLEQVKKCALAVGHVPSSHELREFGLSASRLYRRFGSVKNAVDLAGLSHFKDVRTHTYSDQQLLKSLLTFKSLHDRLPSRSDWKRGLIGINPSTFNRRFGTTSASKIIKMHSRAVGGAKK